MSVNLESLIEKIYQESLEKARKEADDLLDKARKEADEMLAEARRSSEEMTQGARNEMENIRQKAMVDIKLAGQQAIDRLKQEIRNLVKMKVLDQPISGLFSDSRFLGDLILSVVKSTGELKDLELVLSDAMRGKLDKALEANLQKEIEGLTVSFDQRLKGGFRIVKKKSDYMLTFTDADFSEFFRPYLDSKTRSIFLDTEA
jgi:V/A-type H+/Na+-transporting ATPase subunit E